MEPNDAPPRHVPPAHGPLHVKIYESIEQDLAGAKVIDGFPSVGLVSTIASNFLIDIFDLKQCGIMDSDHFPTLSVVHDGEPLNPVRIYSGTYDDRDGKNQRIVVFISEFQPAPELVRPVAFSILEWVRAKGCDFVLSPEGLVLEGEGTEDDIVEVYTIGSTERARELLQRCDAPLFKDGIVAGVTGVLLNMGKRENVDVLGILSEAQSNYPDARSAATVVEIIGKILGVDIDVEPLLKEAEGFEDHIRKVRKQARLRDEIDKRSFTPSMYG